MTRGARALSEPVWNALLERLGADAESAGMEYERLRQRLIRFFEWKGCVACEDHADDVLTRLARRISDGEAIASVQAYALGVARFVVKEAGAAPLHLAIDEARGGRLPSAADAEPDARADCLDRCLDAMPQATRHVTLRYYEGSGGAKVKNRRTIATELGISERALRLRVFRARESLEECVSACLGGG
jgi:DNA-directed RNA polymerase specialized sigma24 family protein